MLLQPSMGPAICIDLSLAGSDPWRWRARGGGELGDKEDFHRLGSHLLKGHRGSQDAAVSHSSVHGW